MKYILLFVTLLTFAGTACKKSKKDKVTAETLQGSWQEQLSIVSSARPIYITFRGDSTYTQLMGDFVGTLSGTYSTTPTGNFLQTILTRTGGTAKDTLLIKISSSNRLVITYRNATVREFLRQ